MAPSDEGAGCALAQTEGEKPRSRNLLDSTGALSLLPSAANAADTFLVRGRQGLHGYPQRKARGYEAPSDEGAVGTLAC